MNRSVLNAEDLAAERRLNTEPADMPDAQTREAFGVREACFRCVCGKSKAEASFMHSKRFATSAPTTEMAKIVRRSADSFFLHPPRDLGGYAAF